VRKIAAPVFRFTGSDWVWGRVKGVVVDCGGDDIGAMAAVFSIAVLLSGVTLAIVVAVVCSAMALCSVVDSTGIGCAVWIVEVFNPPDS